jgi:hypothetical protein
LAEKTTTSSRPDVEAQSSNADNAQLIPISPKVPFYRTRKGITAIIVLVVVIAVAAIVGGSVAASKKKPVSSHQGSGNANTNTVVITVHATPTVTTPAIFPSIYIPDPTPTIISGAGLIGAGIN